MNWNQLSWSIWGRKLSINFFRASSLLGYVPMRWRESEGVFILKPGRSNYSQVRSFRPISLSSFIVKALDTQPAFSHNKIYEIAFRAHFCCFSRANYKIFAHFCTLRGLPCYWKAVGLEQKGHFLWGTLEGVLEVSILWHILSNSLLSTWKCGFCFPIIATLQLSLLNGWKGC